MIGPVRSARTSFNLAISELKTMNSSYALDKSNAKVLGVCAGLARSTGWDPLVIRLGAVAATLLLLGPVAVVLYLAAALLAESR
jgi:phage shock protein C